MSEVLVRRGTDRRYARNLEEEEESLGPLQGEGAAARWLPQSELLVG
jgi:hypothetical protein